MSLAKSSVALTQFERDSGFYDELTLWHYNSATCSFTFQVASCALRDNDIEYVFAYLAIKKKRYAVNSRVLLGILRLS